MHAVQATPATVVSQAVPLNHGNLVKNLPAMSAPDLAITPQEVSGPPTSLNQASQASVLAAPMCTLITKVTPAVGQASKVASGSKVTATQQAVPPKMTQATIQLPANFQIPPGTVLIKSANGQLMLVSQQALARAQAQVQSAKAPASSNAQTVHMSNTAGTPGSVTKMSSPMVSKAGSSVSAPTVVRICAPPQTIANSQGNSAVIIRASAPSATPITTLSCTLPSTVITAPASTGVSSAAGLNATTVTMVPVRTSSPRITPVTNSGASIVVPATTVSSATKALTSNSIIDPVNSDIVQTNNQQVAANSSAIKMASTNICITATTTVASPPIIVSSIAPASTVTTAVMTEKNRTQQMQTSAPTLVSSVVPKKVEPSSKLQSTQHPNASEALDNVKKCKNFLATLIKLASSGPQSQTMGQNVKNLVKNLLDSKLEAEEFTTKLYKELKSSPQPYLVPFLKKSLPSLRRMMPNSQDFIIQCGPQNPTPPVTATNSLPFVKITPTTSIKPASTTIFSTSKVPQATIAVPQTLSNLKAVNFKQLVVQQPAAGIVKHVTALPPGAAVTFKPGEKQISLNTLIQAGHLTPASVLKQITLPGNKVNSLQASLHPIKENGTACFSSQPLSCKERTSVNSPSLH